VLPKDVEREEWLNLSASRLQSAYDNDEEEYSVTQLKNQNPKV